MLKKLIILCMCTWLFMSQAQEATFCDELIAISRIIETTHYQPKPVNDSLSKGVFNLFLDQLDQDKRFFIQNDIEQLQSDEFTLDDYIKAETCDFIIKYTAIFGQRIIDAKAYLENQRKLTLNYEGADSLYYDPDIKNSYFKTKSAAERYWSKRVRYKVLQKLVESDSVLEQITRNFKSREAELRGKIIDNEICLLTEFEQSKGTVQRLVENTFLDALLKYQDPNSAYLSTSEKQLFEQSVSNSQSTFGIATSNTKNGDIVISHITPGSTAFKNGNFDVDDVIISLSNLTETIDTYCISNETILNFLNDVQSSKITFKIKKKNGQIKTISLNKSDVKVEANSVTGYVIKDDIRVGYIQIPSFYTDLESINGLGVSNDVAKQIYKLQNEQIEGLVLDLRFNGGGSMKEATELSGMFIDRGPVAISKYRGEENYTIKDPNRGRVFKKPIVVLVNQFSASASEFFAGAMQDYNTAIIVGTVTHGKATSQFITPINNTETSNFVKLTIGKFFRVTGKSHQNTGVIPDILLPSIYNNYKTQEKYSPFSILNASTEVNWIHKPNPKNDLNALKNKSIQRTSNSNAFKTITKFNKVFVNEYINRKGVYPLSLEFIFNDNLNYNNAWKDFTEQQKQNKPTFTVDNTSSTQSIVSYNEDDLLTNTARRDEILMDPYIQEAYYIINDILKF